jgi:RimJ/RimL family protein N-acetyltransferase
LDEIAGRVELRDVEAADLPWFFEFERDARACWMAAFTAEDPSDREAFDAHWRKVLANPAITKRTIVFDGKVAGYAACFEREGVPEVCYWIGPAYWGKGIATRALRLLVGELPARPLFARVAKDNLASLRVLAKCGFVVCGEGRYFAAARGQEIEEAVLRLEA